MKRLAAAIPTLLLAACSSAPKKPQVPALTPEAAHGLLQFDNRAHGWIEYVKRHNTACEYEINLPDQSNQPAEIDLDHIVWCSGQPGPKEFDASVVFVYDPDQGKWTIKRFSS